MPETKILDASLGSRHRAALGITEETDAVVVVVSEERGTISFCFSGNIVSNLDGQSLRHALLGLFGRSSRKRRFAKKAAFGRPSLASSPPRISVVSPSPAAVAPAGLDASKPAAPRPPTPIEGKPPASVMKGLADAEPRSALRTTSSSTMKIATSTPMPVRSTEPGRSVSPPPPPPAAQDGERPSSERGRAAMVDLPAAAAASDTPVPSQRTFVPTAGQGGAAGGAAGIGVAEGTPTRDEP
jgi:diadenylate cyclase